MDAIHLMVAKQLSSYFNDTFNESKAGSIKRHYRSIPYDQIYTKGPPVRTFDIDGTGITNHYSAYIDHKRVRYRAVSSCNIYRGSRWKRQL